jgi:hypothetical protein
MKNQPKCAGLTILAVVMLFQGFSVVAQKEDAGARALFYDPVTGATLTSSEKRKDPETGMVKVKRGQSNQAKYVGIHYWIELEGVGPVTANRTFRTGDRIRLHVRSNVDGYLSLWALDPSGHGQPLFPTPGQKNFVKADTPYVTPGHIVFKPPVQDERLLVFFSRSEKDLPAPSATSTEAEMIAQTLGPTGERALVFETEEKNAEELGGYAVNKEGGPVAKEVRLKHQPRGEGQ